VSGKRCCCNLKCADRACDWWPCCWHIAFSGGSITRKQRWTLGSNSVVTDCNGNTISGPILTACESVTCSVAPISGYACLDNYGDPDCVCGYTDPAWDGTYSSAECAAGDVSVSVTLSRSFELVTPWRNAFFPFDCLGTAGVVTDTATATIPFRLDVTCDPLIGNFPQTTDGRIQWRAYPANANNNNIGFGYAPSNLTAFGAAYLGYPAQDLMPVPTFVAWAWPKSAPATLGPTRLPEWPFDDYPFFNAHLNYGAGALVPHCQLGWIEPREVITIDSMTSLQFGALEFWVRTAISTTITPCAGTTP
jgi:hypothetical protein